MRPHPPERVEEFVAAGWWSHDPARSWDELLRARAAERPDATALVDPANREALLGSEPRRLTWAQLDASVTETAGQLAGHGVGVDDVVGTQLPNAVELLVTTLAITRLGAIVCPFPTAYREHELSTLAPVAGLTVMVTVGVLAGRDHATSAAATGVRVLVWDSGTLTPDAGRGPVERLRRHPSEAATLCWTSGTEAAPKGVPRCANGWAVIGAACAAAPALTADDVILNPFPLVNMAGFGGVLVPWLLTGATLVQHHPFDLPTFLAPDRDERVSYTLAPPALLAGMLDARPGCWPRADLSSSAGHRLGFGAAARRAGRGLARALRDRGDQLLRLQRGHRRCLGDQHTVPDPETRARYFPRFGAAGTCAGRTPIAKRVRTRLVDPVTGDEITDAGRAGRAARGRPHVVRRLLGRGRRRRSTPRALPHRRRVRDRRRRPRPAAALRRPGQGHHRSAAA